MLLTSNHAEAAGNLPNNEIDEYALAQDTTIVLGNAGTITEISERAAKMFGYTPDELLGMPFDYLLPARADLTVVACTKTGDELPIDITVAIRRDDSGEIRVRASVREGASRRQIEEALRASEENFRLLVEGVGDHAILMLDPFGRVVTWNQGAQRIKGWDPVDILGTHFSQFYVPEDIASGQPERDLELAAAEGRTEHEGWRVRSDGQRFWAETMLSAVRDHGGALRGFANVTRDRTENHQARARLETFAELNRAALEQRPDDDLLELVVSRARTMVGAPLVAAWSPARRGHDLVVAYAEGPLAPAILNSHAGSDSVIAEIARAAHAQLVPDLRADPRVPAVLAESGFGSALFLPVRAANETFAVLGVMTAVGREPLQPYEVDLLEAFGLQAAASFALARARRDTEQLHLVSDRERIARDLHDSVIQRLFAVGLSLEATSRLPAAETKQRLQQAVSDIDETIRSIRSSIFTLESRPDDRPGLRRQVLDVASDATEALGYEPSVQFDGPVDTVASAEVTESLVAVLREALSNVARHAHATSATITVTADDDIVLVVDDDGRGSSTFARDGGHGVANLHERAQMLGGECSITARDPQGTRVAWRVPVSR